MNRKRMAYLLALAAVIVLAALGWLATPSKTSLAAPAPSAEAPFKGKVLLVHLRNMMPVYLLEKAQVQKVGDRACLVGKGVADGKTVGWHKGRTVWLPMEHIVSIVEYDDLKDAKKALETWVGAAGYAAMPAPIAVDAPALPPAPPPVPPFGR